MTLVGFFVTSSACQTLDPIPVPPEFDQIFATCPVGKGAQMLRLYKNEQIEASLEFDWSHEKLGQWNLHFFDPLGNDVLAIEWNEGAFTKRGPLAEKLPVFDSDDGFLTVDGHRIGVRVEEVPCLFGQAWPDAWRRQLVAIGQQQVMEFRDECRVMTTAYEPEPQRHCAAVEWGFFFKKEFSWCRQEKRRELAFAEYLIKMDDLD